MESHEGVLGPSKVRWQSSRKGVALEGLRDGKIREAWNFSRMSCPRSVIGQLGTGKGMTQKVTRSFRFGWNDFHPYH